MRWRRVITVRLVPSRRATEEAACQGAVRRGGLGRYTTCVGASSASHVSRQAKRILPVEIPVGKFPCRAPQQAGPFAQCTHSTLARSACDASSHNLSKTATKSSSWCALCEPQPRASLCLVAPGVALQRTVQQRAACLVPVFSACSPAASLHLQPQRERESQPQAFAEAQPRPASAHSCVPAHHCVRRSRLARRRAPAIVARMRQIDADLSLDPSQAVPSHGALQHKHHVIHTPPDRHGPRSAHVHARAAPV